MNHKEDLFRIQVRLFRKAQVKWNLSSFECDKLFDKYGLFDYIKTCYEEYHVQGDEVNLCDMEQYLRNKGYSI